MRFSNIIAFGLFGANSALGLAILPREIAEIESVANATAKGIDVFGPIPDDAVKAHEGFYTAEEGTDAWAWIRAQIDIPAHARPATEKRQNYANIGIGMFAQDWCKWILLRPWNRFMFVILTQSMDRQWPGRLVGRCYIRRSALRHAEYVQRRHQLSWSSQQRAA